MPVKSRSKTHYATCERATESDNTTYWSEYTACGLQETEAPVSDDKQMVTCKRCLRALKKPEHMPDNYLGFK